MASNLSREEASPWMPALDILEPLSMGSQTSAPLWNMEKVPLVCLGTSKWFFWSSVYVEDEDGTMDRGQGLYDTKGIWSLSLHPGNVH